MMSDRERWTVYPLIFLTLGIALKDKLFRVINVDDVLCRKVLCNTLVVADPKGKPRVVVSSSGGGGLMRVLGGAGRQGVLIGSTNQWTGMLLVDPEGNVRPTRTATPTNIGQPNEVQPDGFGPPSK